MATTNPVFQVLITSGNQAPLAAGSRPDALNNGQIGVFNYHTGLSIDGTAPADAKDIFLAVGINRTTGGTDDAEDINTSAGQCIQVRNTRALTFKGRTAGQNNVWKISGFTVEEGDELVVKIEFRLMAQYLTAGYVPLTKTFSVVSAGTDEAAAVTALINTINADPDKLVVASSADTGTSLVLTSQPFTDPKFTGDINIKYNGLMGTNLIVSTTSGFTGRTIAETAPLRYSEGRGADLREKEYIAGGWNGKPGPYRQSSVHGLARTGFEFFASPDVNYHQFSIAYDQEAVAGWEEYKNNLETIIGVPVADTTTLTGLAAIFDAIFTQFGAMANDVAANDTEGVATNALLPATDGVESLS